MSCVHVVVTRVVTCVHGWDQRSCVHVGRSRAYYSGVWHCELTVSGSEGVGPAKPCGGADRRARAGGAHQGRVLLGQWCAGRSPLAPVAFGHHDHGGLVCGGAAVLRTPRWFHARIS